MNQQISAERSRTLAGNVDAEPPQVEASAPPLVPDAQPALIDLRNRGQFLHVLESLKCSLALSRRPSGVALLGVTDGAPTR